MTRPLTPPTSTFATSAKAKRRTQFRFKRMEAAGKVILDFDRDGRLIGIDVLGARNGLPEGLVNSASGRASVRE
jgi:uncharacterized protein YuzE